MKHSKFEARCKTSCLPELRFEDQQLTSFSGLIVFQQLFSDLDLKRRLSRCFEHQKVAPIFPTVSIMLVLIVGVLLGYRRLRDVSYFNEDPMVLRVLSLRRMPSVSTMSRQLAAVDDRSVRAVERVQQSLVTDALVREQFPRITLDFDGTVLGTGRRAEGASVGFNPKKKGQRSYYPLNCTVAQSAQVLAVHHRSGNSVDSHGAESFIRECVESVRKACPQAIIEARLDSAFFNETIIQTLEQLRVEYTISVPFERYSATIKCYIEERRRWRRLGVNTQFFEKKLSLKSWSNTERRFVFVRQRSKIRHKGPVQLDLFLSHDYEDKHKVIITNKTIKAKHIVSYHEGRGSQEGLFAELKSQMAMSYVPCNSWNANKLYLLSNVFAHNLGRELQMRNKQRARNTSTKRPALWQFTQIGTLRKRIIQRAGRMIRPHGVLTLSMASNDAVQNEIRSYLQNQ